MDETSRIIGTLQAGLKSQNERLDVQDKKLGDMDGKLDQLLANQQQQRGARKLAAWLGTGAGSLIGVIIGWIIEIKTSGH